MKSAIFNSFEEASAFARSLAIKGINQNLSRNGNLWQVEHDEPSIVETSLQVKSEREDALLNKIQSLEEDRVVLQKNCPRCDGEGGTRRLSSL